MNATKVGAVRTMRAWMTVGVAAAMVATVIAGCAGRQPSGGGSPDEAGEMGPGMRPRVIDRKVRAGAHGDPASIRTMEGEELDLDALMADLSADEEIVRVKEIEFAPMTEEEALIQIDLLGHDFFAYTDRDTEAVCVP